MAQTKTKTLDSRTIVVASANQVSSELAGEAVILDLNAGVYHGLNGTGARLWSLLTQPRTIGEMCQTLLSEYDVEPGQCERDVVAVIEKLASKGLVEIRPAA